MSYPTKFFYFRNQKLVADGVPLESIAKKLGTPLYVYSASGFLNQLSELQKGLSELDPLICFAVKANSNVAILKMLAKAGAGVDLVSGGELYRAQRAGVPGNRIVFSGVGKTAEEMREALKCGIFSFNVESVAELELLSSICTAIGRKAPVALRFNPDVDAKTHPYISTGLKKNKFGMDRSEILKVCRAKSHFPGVDIRGISIHIGSQLLSLAPLEDAYSRVRSLIAELSPWIHFRHVDLGGGVGIAYKNEKPPGISDYCRLIRNCFGPNSGFGGKVVLEPGRLISGNSGALICQVLFRKTRGKKDFLVVDAGMNDLARPSLYGSYHEIVALKKRKGPVKSADVVGPVCESSDCFATNRALSSRLGSGDLLAILSSGAYGFSMAGNYNSRPRPPEVLVQKGKFKIIRRRETLDDLIRGEIF